MKYYDAQPLEQRIDALKAELQAAEDLLERVQEDLALCHADISVKRQELERETMNSHRQDLNELAYHRREVARLRDTMNRWRSDQRVFYQAQIDEMSTNWLYQLYVFFVGYFLGFAGTLVELKDITQLQKLRDTPPWEEEQQQWKRDQDNHYRTIGFLESLAAPRETTEMKDVRTALMNLTRKLSWLETQVVAKEEAVKKAKARLDQALAFQGPRQSSFAGNTASQGPQPHTASSSHQASDAFAKELAEQAARLAEAQAQVALAQAVATEALRRMREAEYASSFFPAASQPGYTSALVNPTADVIDAPEVVILTEE